MQLNIFFIANDCKFKKQTKEKVLTHIAPITSMRSSSLI
jgi:hypothetical protein